MSAKPFNPNDQSTWPTAKYIRKFEKTIETVHPSGQVDRVHYKVDPNSPADIAAAEADQAKHYVRQRLTREPNSPEAQAFFLAEMEEIRRSAEESAQLREAALAAEHARLQASVVAASTSPAIPGVAMSSVATVPAAAPTHNDRSTFPTKQDKVGRIASTSA